MLGPQQKKGKTGSGCPACSGEEPAVSVIIMSNVCVVFYGFFFVFCFL